MLTRVLVFYLGEESVDELEDLEVVSVYLYLSCFYIMIGCAI